MPGGARHLIGSGLQPHIHVDLLAFGRRFGLGRLVLRQMPPDFFVRRGWRGRLPIRPFPVDRRLPVHFALNPDGLADPYERRYSLADNRFEPLPERNRIVVNQLRPLVLSRNFDIEGLGRGQVGSPTIR